MTKVEAINVLIDGCNTDNMVDTWRKDLHAPATGVTYINLLTTNHPNQFWYAVPEGLVKPEEVPAYAGLIYCMKSGYAKVHRRAPFLHKRKLDLTAKLLQKYYNLWQYHTGGLDKKIEILTSTKETDEQN